MLMEDFRISNSSPSVLIVKEGREDYDIVELTLLIHIFGMLVQCTFYWYLVPVFDRSEERLSTKITHVLPATLLVSHQLLGPGTGAIWSRCNRAAPPVA
jgi:hypothetical protein